MNSAINWSKSFCFSYVWTVPPSAPQFFLVNWLPGQEKKMDVNDLDIKTGNDDVLFVST